MQPDPVARERVGDRVGQPRRERDLVERLAPGAIAAAELPAAPLDPAHGAPLRDRGAELRDDAGLRLDEEHAALARLRLGGLAELAGERGQARLAGGHPLPAEIHGDAAHLAGGEPPADAIARLEHDHVEPGAGEPARADQAGQARPDDDRIARHAAAAYRGRRRWRRALRFLPTRSPRRVAGRRLGHAINAMMGAMADQRLAPPRPERLLAVIELQNAIAAAGMNADEVMHIVAQRAATVTSAAGAAVALAEGDELVVRAASRATGDAPPARLPRSGAAGVSLAERRPISIDDAATDPRVDAETRARTAAASLLYVPLLYGEAAVGVIELAAARPAPFTDEDIETLRLFAQIIAIALHRAYTYPRPRQDILHDALTGLGNRRAYDERIEAELARNERYGHSFSLARIELDGLEDAGDRFGQSAADEALRVLAVILKRDTRAIDACFRTAADEFAIVMPGTSLEGARILVERCRAHLAETRLCEGLVRASFGVVEAEEETPDALAARVSAAIAEDKARRAPKLPGA